MKVRVCNTLNGQIQYVPESFLKHSKYHEPVGEDVKPFDPKLYTPKTAEEFRHVHQRLTEPALEIDPIGEEEANEEEEV